MSIRHSKEWVYRIAGSVLASKAMRTQVNGYFRSRINIVFYHGVWRRDQPQMKLFGGIELQKFADEMRFLSERFQCLDMNTVMSLDKPPVGKPVACVTFDDGFDLIGSGALDAMEAVGVPATVFVNSMCVNDKKLMWQHAIRAIRGEKGDGVFLDCLKQVDDSAATLSNAGRQLAVTRRWSNSQRAELTDQLWEASQMPAMDQLVEQHHVYLNYDDMRKWISRGHVVGFHTHSHPFCSSLDTDEMHREIMEPGAQLKAELDLRQMPFAYPFGDRLQPNLEQQVAKSGVFTCLLGTAGSSAWGTCPASLERIETENGVATELFGRPILKAIKKRCTGKPNL